MRNKIVRIFIYVAVNVLFFLQLFLLNALFVSPLFSIIMLVINGRYNTSECVLIWVALSLVLSIVISIRLFLKTHKMKHK